MKEKNIQELAKRMGLVTVEDMCQYTIAQLVVKIANKVNELVDEVWRFETDVQETLKTQNEKIQYLLGEGLHLELENIFDGWVQDGTFDTLINQSALKKVNERIDETNIQLSTLSTEIDIERKRIDSFVTLPEGSTSGDAELMDIRIGVNNVKYTNAGDAVRSQFMDVNNEINKIEDKFKYKNLLDIENLTMGFLDLSGKHFNATNYYYTDFIPFDSSMSIQLLRANNSNLFKTTSYNQTNMRYITAYDINKNVIKDSGLENVSTSFSTTDGNVKYIRVSILSGYITDAKNNTMLTYGDVAPEQYNYIPYGFTLDKLLSNGNGLELVGKRVLVLGDSIAYGEGSTGCGIASLLAEKYGCTTKNYAVSGATVINSSNSMLQQYNQIIEDFTSTAFVCEVDYIIFDGGANDMVTNKLSPLGTLSEYYGNEVTTDNFTGAFETLIRNLQTKFPHAKLIYFTNHRMQTRNKVNMDTYFNRAKEIMQKYGIEVVDITSISGLNTCIGTQHSSYCPDKTHPNKEGYLKFYIPYIVDAMKKCIC